MDDELNTDATLDEMSDNDIIMDFEYIQDLCAQWNSKVITLDLTSERIIKGLKRLTDYSINEQYEASLATAVNSLTLTMTEIVSAIIATSDKQQTVDYDYPAGGSNSGTYNYDTSTGMNSDTTSASIINNENEKDEITVAKIEEIATVDDYLELSIMLSSIVSNNDGNLDNVLDKLDETQIKNKILSSVNLSDELKLLLYNADISVLKESLKKFYKNGEVKVVGDEQIKYLSKYIDKIALKNNISVTELLTNDSNQKLLNEEMQIYGEAINLLKNKDKQSIVQNIFDGNVTEDVNENLVKSVRDVINLIADERQISAEEVVSKQEIMSSFSDSNNFISELNKSSNLQNSIKELYTRG